jgi:uncharacterized protein (TIGR03437 family)
MRSVALFLGLLLESAASLSGAVTIQTVTDAAAYGPRVAPGSLASIFGSNLASGPLAATSFPLPVSLGGTSVVIGGAAVPLTYVDSGQINFQVPSGLKAGTQTLVVKAPGGNSSAFAFTVTAEAPAIFTYGTTPAAAGSVITVYLTGQGALDHAVADGTAAPSSPLSRASATATATIGPLNAPIQFLGLAPGFAGLAQANIQVPSLPTGDYPLVLTIGGAVSASTVVSVTGTGAATSPLALVGSAAFANATTSSIVFYNNIAYVCGPNRITMVDVTTATAPSVIGEFGDSVLNGNGSVCALNLGVSVPYLVDIVGGASFAVYSLATPRSPALLGVTATSYKNMVDLSFSGSYGFSTTSYTTFLVSNHSVTAQNGDFLAFDFSTPSTPQYVGIVQPSSTPGSGNQNLKPAASVVGQGVAYVASSTATGSNTSGTGVLEVISVASPFAPYPLNQVAVSQSSILQSFDISGTTLLVAGNSGGQRNPGNPNLDYTGNLTLTAMDVTNLSAPNPISTFVTGMQVNGTPHTAAFSNGVFAIVNNPPSSDDTGPASLMIVDARIPSNIVLYPYQTQFGFSGIVATTGGYLLAPTLLGLNVYQLKLE